MINSKWGVSQTYRSRFVAELPKVYRPTKSKLKSLILNGANVIWRWE